jgi:membrane protein DedA with SNARE-associated domain
MPLLQTLASNRYCPTSADLSPLMSFEQIVQAIADYPYLGVAAVFLLCGIGLPLPEEIVLLAAGYVCAKFPDHAQLVPMMGWCAGAILLGDVIPFSMGRIFGVRLLRLRWLRYFITKQRLATFDRWFRQRGDLVIVISRFLAGLRIVAFFTAGAMKMRWSRFLFLDGLGIILMVPLLIWLGYTSSGVIQEIIDTIETVEDGLLIASIAGAVAVGIWIWWWRRRRHQKQRSEMKESFVQPKKPVHTQEDPQSDPEGQPDNVQESSNSPNTNDSEAPSSGLDSPPNAS